jgi:hypothetical protein
VGAIKNGIESFVFGKSRANQTNQMKGEIYGVMVFFD